MNKFRMFLGRIFAEFISKVKEIRTLLCGKCDVIFSYIYTKTCTSFILFISLRLILNAFN